MATEIKIVEEAKAPLAMNPRKFALWLFMVTVGMRFAAWTSAYLVKRADTGWAEIVLPWHFWLNTALIALSSVTMVVATRAARHNKAELVKVLVTLPANLGVCFLGGLWLAYGGLVVMHQSLIGGYVSHS